MNYKFYLRTEYRKKAKQVKKKIMSNKKQNNVRPYPKTNRA